MSRDLDDFEDDEPVEGELLELVSGNPASPQAQVIDCARVIATFGNRELAIQVAAFAAELAVGP